MSLCRPFAALCASAVIATAQVPQFAPSLALPGSGVGFPRSCLGDWNGDGALDLYVGQTGFLMPFGPGLFANDGTGGLVDVTHLLPVNGDFQSTPAFIDFDGDGDLDLYVSQGYSRLFRNNGGGPWTDVSTLLPTNFVTFRSLAVTDFDGDGDTDIAGTGFSLGIGSNKLLVNGGAAGFAAVEPFPGQGGVILALDFDGDTDEDVYVGGFTARLWRNDGALTFTEVTATHLPALAGVNAGAAGDVDGDGDPDLVLGANAGGTMLLRNTGGVFTIVPGAVPPVTAGNGVVLLVDVDGDVDLDLMHGMNQTVELARNDGSGVFTAAPNGTILAGTTQIVAGDLDRDGDLDLVASDQGVGTSLWWNRHRHVASTGAPVRGHTWTVQVTSQPGYGSALRPVQLGVGLARLPQPWLLPPFGALWLDFAVPVLLAQGVAAPGVDVATFPFVIPAVPALAGIVLHTQALIDETPGPTGPRFTTVRSAAIQ